MALNANFRLPGPFGSVPAYFMIAGVQMNRLSGGLELRMAVFKDSAARAAFKTMVQRQAEVLMIAADARAVLSAGNGTADETQTAFDANKGAQQEFAAIEQQMAAAPPLMDQPVSISPATAKELLDESGMPVLAKIYAWLKTTPGFWGATDA